MPAHSQQVPPEDAGTLPPNRRSLTGSLQTAQLRVSEPGSSVCPATPRVVRAPGWDSSRWRLSARHSLAENGSKRRRRRGLRGPSCAGSRSGRAVAPARGEASPGGTGKRARRPERPPSSPALPMGLIPPTGGAPMGARTQRANRVRPRLGAVPRSPRSSESAEADSCVRYVLACRGSQAAIPKPLGAWLGALGPAAQVRWPRARKQDSRGRRLPRRAPRR
ncbi:hypothetical protein P7K49_033663 [Saguinus oedipus]|uniref:Uncharacterized protein n=1 Tax=Saguinus oedipus TaxID=9490 RepID=A0ABQ9TSY0_SAGOE|nr:hypothetical protein P7K49_033663 [Saguinus oedipus]